MQSEERMRIFGRLGRFWKSTTTSIIWRMVIFSLVACHPALAQSPPDAGSLLRQQEERERKFPDGLPETEAPEVVRPAMRDIGDVKILVTAVRFSGAVDLVPEAELKALVRDAIGRELDFAALQQLADRVTEHLRNKGFLLARAYLPKQDVTEGVIEIAILKGRLDGAAGKGGGWHVALNEEARIVPGRLAAICEAAAPSGSAVRQEELERALLLVNDLPGVSARSRLQPGETSGSTRIIVDASEGPLFTGSLWADNFGNRSTGTAQLNAFLNVNDPSGIGDHAGLQVSATEGIRFGRIGYDLPLGVSGLRTSAGYTFMDYEVVEGVGEDAGLEGRSHIGRLALGYPLIRQRKLNLHANLGYSYKALEDDSSAGTLRDKRLHVVTLGFSGDVLDRWLGGGLTSWGLALTGGDLDLSRVAADEAGDAAGLGTRGSYRKLTGNLARLQKLPGPWTLLGKVSGQLAGDNLDSSEEFILGGPGGVRAYPVNEAQGDEGWLAGLELRYDLPGGTPVGELQLSAFADTGEIRVHHDPAIPIPTATGRNHYNLSGGGLMATLSKTARYRLQVVWAHKLGNNPGRTARGEDADGRDTDDRFWVQGIFLF